MGYVRDHWLGRHAFAWSFWINFALPCVLFNVLEAWVRPAPEGRLLPLVILACLYVIACHVIIYPWQVVGLLRACDRYIAEEKGDLITVTAAQGAIIISLVAGVSTAITTLQSAFGTHREAVSDIARNGPRHRLEVIPGRSMILINGIFDPGLSRDLKALLTEQPEIRGIMLESDGGRVFEARGVAKQILDHGLDTYVYETCRSACTIAFIAGAQRFLGERGQLGFHSYAIETAHPFIDVAAEQDKDRTFFQRRGVAPDLLDKAFATPHQSIWYPDAHALLAANVVHQIVRDDADLNVIRSNPGNGLN